MFYPLTLLIDIIFPSACVSCLKPVTVTDRLLCRECRSKISPAEEKCPRCSGRVFRGECGICSDREFYLAKNITLTDYSGVMKSIMLNLKFHHRKSLAHHLGEIGSLGLIDSGLDFDIITYVPMNRKKQWKRGFNQSRLISKNVSKKLKKPFLQLLKENFRSITQKDLGYRERFINVLGRYSPVNRSRIQGRKILIIDDIFTTGATLNECARVLMDSGAKGVFSLTIARVTAKKA